MKYKEIKLNDNFEEFGNCVSLFIGDSLEGKEFTSYELAEILVALENDKNKDFVIFEEKDNIANSMKLRNISIICEIIRERCSNNIRLCYI